MRELLLSSGKPLLCGSPTNGGGVTRMQFPNHTVTALIGKAVGDAFGCPFEYHESAPEMAVLSIAEGRYLSCYEDVHQPVKRCRTSGLYSDDTQQALVLLWIWSQMLAKGKDPLRADLVAELFIKVCRRMSVEPVNVPGAFGVHRGTGRNFREVILKDVAIDTAGLGGAMRIGPAATLIDDSRLVIPWAVEVTSATTSNPFALVAAARVAAIAWAISRSSWSTLLWAPDFGFLALSKELKDAWNTMAEASECLRVGEDELLKFASAHTTETLQCAAGGFALTGVPWAIHCVNQATSFEDALVRACASGGDTDTVCAIVGMLAALRFGQDTIPTWMTANLVGREHIVDPSLWHPITSERPYVQMDRALQNGIEKQLREAAKARAGKRQP